MAPWLLDIIRCPLSGHRLVVAEATVVERMQQQQQAGKLFSHTGIPIEASFDGGLVDQAGTYFYRVADNIPSLLPDEAIKLPTDVR